MQTVPTALLLASVLAAGVHADELPPGDQARGLVDPDPVEAEDVALFVPRVALAVPRLAFGIVTFPLVGAIKAEERYHVMGWLEDLFYNDARTAAIMPVVSFATFTGASIGAVAFHDDLFGHGEKIRLRGRFAGSDDQSYELSFRAGQMTSLGTMVRFESAPDLLFRGIGADIPEVRFAEDRLLGLVRAGHRLGPVEVSATAVYNHREITDDTMTVPDGEIDTLELLGGVLFASPALRGELFFGGVPAGASYLHFGAEVTGTIPLFATDRKLLLRGAVETVTGDDVPFTDLPRLGGATRLRGYAADRFRGTTALLATAEYRYPVHQLIDGALFVDAGRVSDNSWRAGGGMGIVVHSKDRVVLSADVAYGEGFQVMFTTDPLRAFARKDTEL